MGQHRMFSSTVIGSDVFLEMPASSQLLYFHLGMLADDDGFVQLKNTMRIIGSSDDDAKILFAKNFLIRFPDGVVIITHWLINNSIRSDRKKPSLYIRHFKELKILENKEYFLPSKVNDNQMTTNLQPNDNQIVSQVKLSKVKLSKVKLRESAMSALSEEENIKKLEDQFPGIDIRLEIEKATDWLKSKGKVQKDYIAFMRNWLRRVNPKETKQVAEFVKNTDLSIYDR